MFDSLQQVIKSDLHLNIYHHESRCCLPQPVSESETNWSSITSGQVAIQFTPQAMLSMCIQQSLFTFMALINRVISMQ